MKKNSILISTLHDQDIPAVVALHEKTIRSIGSAIGKPYLTTLYGLVSDHPHTGCGMVAKDKGTGVVVGSILAVTDPEAYSMMRIVRSNPRMLFALGKGILMGRIGIGDFFHHLVFLQKSKHMYQRPFLAIHALCVDTSLQRMGIGTMLVLAVKKEARKRMIPHLYVDTLKTNTTARRFYGSSGFTACLQAGDSILFSWFAGKG